MGIKHVDMEEENKVEGREIRKANDSGESDQSTIYVMNRKTETPTILHN